MKNNKLPVLLLALACAVLVWLYDVTVINPNDTATIAGIPVQLENEAELRSRNLMVTEGDTISVTLKIKGRRSELKKLTKSNIDVTADLSEISAEGTYELSYTVRFPANVSTSDLSIESRSPATVTVPVEHYSSRAVEIRTVFEGEATNDDSLVVDTDAMTVNPGELTVTGPSAILETIDCARIIINKAEITQTTVKEFSYDLLDQDGNTISRDELVVSNEKLTVSIPVLKYKEVPLTLKTQPGGGATDSNISYTIEPATIKISGEPASVDRIYQIELGTLDYATITGPVTKTYPVLLPEGINNASGITEATADMTVTGLTVLPPIEVTNIDLANTPEGLTAVLLSDSVQVTLRGTPAALRSLNEDDVSVTVDLSGFTQAGTYVIPVTVNLPAGLQVGPIGSSVLTISLS